MEVIRVYWGPGKGNKADYFTKTHPTPTHRALRSTYIKDKDNDSLHLIFQSPCSSITSSQASVPTTSSNNPPTNRNGLLSLLLSESDYNNIPTHSHHTSVDLKMPKYVDKVLNSISFAI